jgi:hypothetical protein
MSSQFREMIKINKSRLCIHSSTLAICLLFQIDILLIFLLASDFRNNCLQHSLASPVSSQGISEAVHAIAKSNFELFVPVKQTTSCTLCMCF